MGAKKERQLNYELLRILAMFMIVCLHYLGKGGLLGDPKSADMGTSGYVVWFIEALCLVAVNVYVLISGYFGVGEKEQPLNTRKIFERPFKIWKQVFFYSVLIGAAAYFISGNTPDIYHIFGYIFPIVTEHYWFATAYIVLCFLMPFLNLGFDHLGKKGMQIVIVLMLVMFSISKTVIPMQLPWDKYGYDAYWFIVLYLTGGYLRRYKIPIIVNRLRAAVMYLLSVTAMFAVFAALRMIYLRTGMFDSLVDYSYSYNYLFCYTGAVGLFLAFKSEGSQVKAERMRKPIELFSGATFGVYLIHEHMELRGMWKDLLHCDEHINGPVGVFLLKMLVTVLSVYLICSFIEMIRIKLSEKGITYLAALILLIYPLRKATAGVDIMDAGYALGNYRFFDTMNETWKIATYLANVVGTFLMKLPFGGTWIGMNVYTGLFVGITASIVYLFFADKYKGTSRIFKCALFAAEFAAVSLCWAPTVILYHYMGYIMMTAASVILYNAIINDKKKNFIISGVILGLSVAVRMPNITYMALILPLWYYYAFGEKKNLRILFNRTLYCVEGYFAGSVIPLVIISARYGITSYPKMISSLFGMTETATDYKPASMLASMFGDYARYSAWLAMFLAYMLIGVIALHVIGRIFSGKSHKMFCRVFKAVYTLGLLVLLRFCYGRGMFGVDYRDYFSIYKWLAVYLLIVIFMCIWALAYKKADINLKLGAVFVLVTIFITPLGSNNGLYPIINNLFIVAPFSVFLIKEVFGAVKSFPFRAAMAFVMVCACVQSVLFGITFVFHDEDVRDGSTEPLQLECTDNSDGLITTSDKKYELEALDKFLADNDLNEKRLITFGYVPALSYIFDMQPAVYTTWVDLESNPLSRFEEELESIKDDYPVVIIGTEYVNGLEKTDGMVYEKLNTLEKFIDLNGYECVYLSSLFQVYTSVGF